MKLWELLAIAVALSMDAFAIADCKIMGTKILLEHLGVLGRF